MSPDQRAFTILELLAVMTIIGILVTISVTVGRGIQERAKIAQAKAEMAALASALEQYKAFYGDYPWTPVIADEPAIDGGAILFNALCGMIGPTGDRLLVRGRAFVDLAKFKLSNDNLPDPATEETDYLVNWFNDPWPNEDGDNWYYYHYKKRADDPDWKNPGFLLYSHGPDGECFLGGAEDSGILDAAGGMPTSPEWRAKNADNLYYGR